MAELLDKETGEVVEVPDEQVGAAFQSGRYGVRKGTRIPVVGAAGEVGTVPVEDIESGSAAAAGFEVADPQRIQEARLESKYGEGAANLQAAGEGVARGLSFGLSDVALRSLGVSEEGLRERRERNPIVSTTTELGGAIAPVLLSGGAGAAGLGIRGAGAAARTGGALRAAGALPRATAALGSRAGQAVTRGLGARGGTLFGRAVSTATEGAVEGAVFGGISTAGQLARGEAPTVEDPDELAELVMTNMGTDALIGGAAGAGFGTGVGLVSGGASAAGRAGRKVFGKLEDTLTKGRKIDDGPVAKQFRESVGDVEPQQAKDNFITELGRQRRALRQLDDTQDETIESFAKIIDRQEELFNDITSASTIQDKLRTMKRLMASSEDVADLQTVGRAADDWVTSLREEVDQIVTDVGSFENRERGAAKRLKRFVDDSQLKIRKATIEGGPDAQAEIFAELDQLKNKAGRLQSRLGGRSAGGSTADDVKFAAGDIIRGKYHEGRDLLERADLWGRAVVDVQVPENRAWSRWFDTRSAFQRRFLTDAGGRRTADGFDQVLRADTKKVGSTVKSFGRTESQLDKEILRRTVQSQDELLRTLASRPGARRIVDDVGGDVAAAGDAAPKRVSFEDIPDDLGGERPRYYRIQSADEPTEALFDPSRKTVSWDDVVDQEGRASKDVREGVPGMRSLDSLRSYFKHRAGDIATDMEPGDRLVVMEGDRLGEGLDGEPLIRPQKILFDEPVENIRGFREGIRGSEELLDEAVEAANDAMPDDVDDVVSEMRKAVPSIEELRSRGNDVSVRTVLKEVWEDDIPDEVLDEAERRLLQESAPSPPASEPTPADDVEFEPNENIRRLADENSQLSREMLEQMDEAQRIADDVDQFQQRLEDARDFGFPFAEKAVRVGAFVGDKASGLSRMMSASRQTRDRVRRAAKAALKFPGEAARRTAKAAPLGVAAAAEKQRGQSRRDRYEETMQRVSAFRNDPATFVDGLAQSVQPFDAVSPELGGAMSAQASRAITFLAEKAPSPKQSPATLRPDLDRTQRVSDAEMARFLRYARAVEDPQSVIEDIANGDVTREAMESLRTVYPRLYGKLLEDVTEFVGELEEQPNFSTLRHLSTILGQPAHPAFEGTFIAGVQANYAQRAEQIKEDAPSPSQRSAPDVSSSMMTGSQEVAQGLGSAGR